MLPITRPLIGGPLPARTDVKWLRVRVERHLAAVINAPANQRLSRRNRLTYAAVARMAGLTRDALVMARWRGRGFSVELCDRVMFALDLDLRDIVRLQLTENNPDNLSEK